MRYLLLVLSLLFILGCKTTSFQSVAEVEKLVKQVENNPQDIIGIVEQTKRSQTAVQSDIALINALLNELRKLVAKEWGEDNTELPSRKKYVKYSNDYQARAIVDFEQSTVTVETIATKNTKEKLKKAIVTTLLTPADPRLNDIFSSEAPKLGSEPFLYQQVLDQDSKAVRYAWRANRFAEYLMEHNFSTHKQHRKTISKVNFKLVADHQRYRQLQYSEYVIAAAKQYQISPALIYAIIETESSFNPYAVSSANAYGLMQVVPATAGRDVYQKIKNRAGQPSKSTLFNPQQNIDIGTAYLHILYKNYLAKINNSTSKEYSVISAYNGGAGNVLKTFDNNRDRAVRDINSLQPKSVYWALTNKHPYAESRRYLQKVTKNKTKY